MGIEIWALVALAAVLAVYLLPFLVGRREVMRLSNAEDRYSSELRVLATGEDLTADEPCTRGGHAAIFRRRPEVKAMNRPAVRNVRVVRTERELVRLRRAHHEARQRRRVAALRRLRVAVLLLGVSMGVGVLAAFALVPWWAMAAPAALLLASLVAGRRAALASMTADRRERRKIAELSRELAALTGVSMEELQERRQASEDVPASVAPAERSVERDVRRGASASSAASSVSAASAPETARDEVRVSRAPDAVASPAAGVEADHRAAAREYSAGSVTSGRSAVSAASGRSAASALSGRSAASAPSASSAAIDMDASQEPEARTTAPATPPQGWSPVRVPAPTYTLAAKARRRPIEAHEDEPHDSAPVPARPTAVRSYATEGVEDEVFQPIDLDAVLERRRAAGE